MEKIKKFLMVLIVIILAYITKYMPYVEYQYSQSNSNYYVELQNSYYESDKDTYSLYYHLSMPENPDIYDLKLKASYLNNEKQIGYYEFNHKINKNNKSLRMGSDNGNFTDKQLNSLVERYDVTVKLNIVGIAYKTTTNKIIKFINTLIHLPYLILCNIVFLAIVLVAFIGYGYSQEDEKKRAEYNYIKYWANKR